MEHISWNVRILFQTILCGMMFTGPDNSLVFKMCNMIHERQDIVEVTLATTRYLIHYCTGKVRNRMCCFKTKKKDMIKDLHSTRIHIKSVYIK